MVMSDELKKVLPRIRTYAQDFEHDRPKSGESLPKSDTPPSIRSSADNKLAAPKPVTISDATKKNTEIIQPDTPKISAHESSNVQSATPNTHKEKGGSIVNAHIKAITPPHEEKTSSTVKVRMSKLPPKKAQSTLSANEPTGTARILTDNKRTHKPLIPSIVAAVKKWIDSYKIAEKQKHIPKYTVTEAERRKGVIQKATSKTGTIFTADNETLREEIRRRSAVQAPSTATDPDIIWTPNTETGFALIEAPHPIVEPVKVTVEFKKHTIPEVTKPIITAPRLQQTPTVPPPVFVEPTITVAPIVEAAAVEEVVTKVDTTLEPEPLPDATVSKTPEPLPPPITQNDPPVSTPAAVVVRAPLPQNEPVEPPQKTDSQSSYTLTTPEAHYRIRSIGDVTKINTNTLSVGVVGAIAGILILVFIGKAVIDIATSPEQILSETTVTPLILDTVIQVPIATETREEILSQLLTTDAKTEQAAEFELVNADNAKIPSRILMDLFGFTNAGGLHQAVTDIRLISADNQWGLVLSVGDPTTTFGTLLSWENRMAHDLSPILGLPPLEETLTVTDETVEGKDVRVFTSNDSVVLVYGFADVNTLLITTSKTSFAAAVSTGE